MEEVAKLRPNVLACHEVFRDEDGDRDTLGALRRRPHLNGDWKWHVSRVSYLQLDGERYKEIASWKV